MHDADVVKTLRVDLNQNSAALDGVVFPTRGRHARRSRPHISRQSNGSAECYGHLEYNNTRTPIAENVVPAPPRLDANSPPKRDSELLRNAD